MIALSATLRPDAFYAGDPGVKLIAATHVVRHPTRPLDLPLPVIAGAALPYVDPFFAVHGDHSHAVASELFPILTAPFLYLFGLRGLYLLPALGFVLAAMACAWTGLILDRQRSAVLMAATAALGTPWLFYGLEFWEHTLALAAGTAAVALFLRNRAVSSGLLFGVAILLRAEAAWFALAILASSSLLAPAPSWRHRATTAAVALLALAPFEAYSAWHFGSLVTPHLAANAQILPDGWLASRVLLVQRWLIVPSTANLWRVAPAMACLLIPFGNGPAPRGRLFLAAVAAIDIVLVVLSAPNDGGAQWGPRYLLFAYIPLAILIADAVRQLSRRRTIGVMAIVLLTGAALWTGRDAYRALRGTKQTYGRLIDFIAGETPPDSYIVTDVWWLDQIAATLTTTRRFVYVPNSADGAIIVRRLSDGTVPSVTVVRSEEESEDRSAWRDGSCYVEEQRSRTSIRGVVAIRLRHRCGGR